MRPGQMCTYLGGKITSLVHDEQKLQFRGALTPVDNNYNAANSLDIDDAESQRSAINNEPIKLGQKKTPTI